MTETSINYMVFLGFLPLKKEVGSNKIIYIDVSIYY